MTRLAARDEPEARHHLLLVHVETCTPIVLHLHRALLHDAVGTTPSSNRSLPDVLLNGWPIAEPAAPWRQYRVLEGCPIKLSTGLDRTKAEPISVPTAPRAYHSFHPSGVRTANGNSVRHEDAAAAVVREAIDRVSGE
jgi:hypothetical protein